MITDYSVDVAVLARRAEELGFDSLWLGEHPIIPVTSRSRYPGSADGTLPEAASRMAEPFVALARASAVTHRIKLGTGVCLVPERNPLLLAKVIATLDHFSLGRFLFGIGAGWSQEETEIMGGRDTLNRLAARAGRDPRSIQVLAYTAPADREALEAYADAGADAAVVRVRTGPEKEALAELEQIARRVLA